MGLSDMLGMGGAHKSVDNTISKMDRLIKEIGTPNFDYSKITPEEYKYLQDYKPEIANFVAEKNPTLVSADSADAVAGRSAQMAALDRYRGLGKTGDDVYSQLMKDRALADAATQNRGQQQSIESSFARRGQLGSGNQLVSALLAQQGANMNATSSAQQAAADSYNRRLEALKQGAALGGDVRNQEVDLSARNAGILNDYNQRFAQNQNSYNQYASGLKNDASQQNISNRQSLNNANVDMRNKATQDYLSRYNTLKQGDYDNSMDHAAARLGVLDRKIGATQQKAQDEMAAISGAVNLGSQAAGAFFTPSTAAAGAATTAAATKKKEGEK